MSRRAEGLLFVGRLSKSTRVRDLEDVFGPYGHMLRCDIKYGAEMAYAFIDFEDRRDAEDCLKYENGREICGASIIVEWAKGNPRRSLGNDECYKCHRGGHWARDCPEDRYGGGWRYSRRYRTPTPPRRRRRSRSRSRDRRRSRSRSRDRRRRSRSRSVERSSRRRHRTRSRSRSKDRRKETSRSRSRSPRKSHSPSGSRSKSRSRSNSPVGPTREENGRSRSRSGSRASSTRVSRSRSISREHEQS